MPRTSDFDYDLPEELIASRPPERREGARMMVVDRASGEIRHGRFETFPSHLRAGDLCVLNDTRVVPARFFSDEGNVELLRTDVLAPRRWKCMVRPGRRMKPGRTIAIGGARGTVESVCPDGERVVVFDREVDEAKCGHLALPPYIGRDDDAGDASRYQTVFAREPGAIAAPTAGLHFTPEILARIRHTFVTLHVGAGTFQPVRVERLEEHAMHTERYEIDGEAADAIHAANRVVAIGTTATRALEHCAQVHGEVRAGGASADIFIYPPRAFRVTGALLTNFHLPKSTLLMLVSAFAGPELIRLAYADAIAERYRFYSYGDCMLIV